MTYALAVAITLVLVGVGGIIISGGTDDYTGSVAILGTVALILLTAYWLGTKT